MKKSTTAILVTTLVIIMTLLPAASGASFLNACAAEQDLYTARTLDGVDLVVKRYRPDDSSALNIGAQPLILMPGVICNHNLFDVFTPACESYEVTLPETLAPWAVGDVYIQADPMKFYSLAYYLWQQGYDVWLANYRGQGRAPVISGGATGYAIDELGIYDMPAIVTRVREVTGQKPVWVGHSLGTVMAFVYLQGAKFSSPTNANSDVVSDPNLVVERNNGSGAQALKGLVSLDGPVIAGGSIPLLMQPILWASLSMPLYLNLRPFTATLGGVAANPIMAFESTAQYLWGLVGYPELSLLNLAFLIKPENMDSNVSKYFFKYVLDGVSTRVVAHISDEIVQGKLREDYRNGFLKFLRVSPPPAWRWDGYYYYSDNLKKITLPSLVIADSTRDITNPEDIKWFYDAKTRDAADAYYEIPGTAHVDLVMGKNAPYELFPKITDWLE